MKCHNLLGFEITINIYLAINCHLIPRIEDLLNEMQIGKYFSKLDLSASKENLFVFVAFIYLSFLKDINCYCSFL